MAVETFDQCNATVSNILNFKKLIEALILYNDIILKKYLGSELKGKIIQLITMKRSAISKVKIFSYTVERDKVFCER